MRKLMKNAAALVTCGMLLSTAALAAPVYTDVPQGAWYADAVEYCRVNELMSGTSADKFNPDGTVSRAMMATVLYRLAGSPAVSTEESPFTDVPAGSWFGAPVIWANQTGYMTGYGSGKFGPNDSLTREQMVTVLWRYMGSPAATAPDFPDEGTISAYAAGAVDWAKSAGVVGGMSDGQFAPKKGANRAQLATILMNYTKIAGGLREASAMDALCQPCGVAAMDDGTLLVTDLYNKVVWQVKDGASTVYAGGSTVEDLYGQPVGGYNDAVLEKSYFKTPWAIAPFLDGWAVSDADNGAVRLIRAGKIETLNATTGEGQTAGGQGTVFQRPTGLAADRAGNLYVSDTLANTVYCISPQGKMTTAVTGVEEPMGLCWRDGVLYIAESGANRIVQLKGSTLSVVAGSGTDGLTDGAAGEAAFSGPQGVTAAENGTIYVSDTNNGAIRQIKDGQVTTLAVRDGADENAFYPVSPTNLLVRERTLYICDTFARKLLVLPLWQ